MAKVMKIGMDAKSKTSNEDQVFRTFVSLLEEQRQLISKLNELECKFSELKVVISTLEKVDGNRKCYRLIGGVLCEKTVKDILPMLIEEKDEVINSQTKLKDDLTKKGVELNDFKEKNNIRIQNRNDVDTMLAAESESAPSASGVLNKS